MPSALDAPSAGERAGLALVALTAIVDGLEHGIVVSDASGRVRILNRSARELLARGPVRLHDGRLCVRSPRQAATLRSLILRCAEDATGGAVRLGDVDEACRIMARVMPLRQPDGFASGLDASAQREAAGLVVVLLVEPCRSNRIDAALLRAQFDLTPAEAALAVEVARGEGLQACARRLGIRGSTARTHLQHVFAKTGTRRQAELVRLLVLCRRLIAEDERPDPRR